MNLSFLSAAPILAFKKDDPLLFGDKQLGFYGLVPSEDFITGTQLIAASGLSTGVPIASNSAAGWLKFAHRGKTLYVAKKPIYINVSYNQLNALGLVSGGKVITVNNKRYKVRLLNASNSTPAAAVPYNELKDLLLKTNGTWITLSAADLGLDTRFNGEWSLSMYKDSNGCHIYGKGWLQNSASVNIADTGLIYGWRPVLELID